VSCTSIARQAASRISGRRRLLWLSSRSAARRRGTSPMQSAFSSSGPEDCSCEVPRRAPPTRDDKLCERTPRHTFHALCDVSGLVGSAKCMTRSRYSLQAAHRAEMIRAGRAAGLFCHPPAARPNGSRRRNANTRISWPPCRSRACCLWSNALGETS
jgi:hypothetical protein